MCQNTLPVVSIIVPMYNAAQTIEDCVNSLICQSYLNTEIVLVDNNSTDETVNKCCQLCEKNLKIKLYQCKQRGVSAARNYGLEKAIGKYIIFVDSDDWLSEDAIESMVSQTCSGRLVKVSQYAVQNKFVSAVGKYRGTYTAEEYIEAVLRNEVHGSVCGVLLERNLLINLRFDEKTGFMEDFLFLLLYLMQVREVNVVSGKYFARQHDNNNTCSKDNILQHVMEIDYTLKHIENILARMETGGELLGLIIKKEAMAVEWKLSFISSFREARRLLADDRIQTVVTSVLKGNPGMFYILYYKMLNRKLVGLFWFYLKQRKYIRAVKTLFRQKICRRTEI